MLPGVFTSLDCVVMAVQDLEAAVDSYARMFGRSPAPRMPGRDDGIDTVRFPLGNTVLALSAVNGRGPFADAVAAFLERRGEGVLSLMFRTDDADACADELRARGLPALDPLDRDGDGSGEAMTDRRTIIIPPSGTRGTLIAGVEHDAGTEGPEGLQDDSAGDAVKGLDHVVVHTPDAEASRRLYQDGLALRLALDRRAEDRGLRMMFFRVGGVTVEVVGSLDQIPSGEQYDRFGGLAWQVDDIPAAHARMSRQGFDCNEHRPGHKPGTRVFTVKSDTCNVPTLIIGPE
jgi:catechol 2,3-dioxygenase-like lactoylglutathione lyase family enzyme